MKLTWEKFLDFRNEIKQIDEEFKVERTRWTDDHGQKSLPITKLIHDHEFTEEKMLKFQTENNARTIIFVYKQQIIFIIMGKLDFDDEKNMPLLIILSTRNGLNTL